jgi:hypothetical protein
MKLSEIQSLVRIIEEYESSDQRPLDLKKLRRSTSNLGKLYRYITQNESLSDAQAANSIYENKRSNPNYKTLKSYFASRLLTNIASLDLTRQGISKQTTALFKADKNLLAISVLNRIGNSDTSVALAKKTLSIAKKYELYHVSIELLALLRLDALQNGKKKEYERLTKQLEDDLKTLDAEYRIKSLENKVRINFSASLFINQKYLQDAKEALKTIEHILVAQPSFSNNLSLFRIQYITYQLDGNLNKSIEACENALKFLEQNPHLSTKIRQAEFYVYKLENYLLLGDHIKGKITADQCSKYYRPGSSNWFKFKEYHFLLLMQSLNFQQALLLHKQIISNPAYQTLSPLIKERWKVFEHYLRYSVSGEHLIFEAKKRSKVKLIIPIQSKDKQGFQVALILLNILSLLEAGKKQEIIRQKEALSTFRFKYLVGKQSNQSFLLFRLIVIMVESEFDLYKMRNKIIGIERKLSKSKPSSAEILECVQILPPLWMWERMKLALTNTKKTSK